MSPYYPFYFINSPFCIQADKTPSKWRYLPEKNCKLYTKRGWLVITNLLSYPGSVSSMMQVIKNLAWANLSG